ncbi:hypothetical protein RMSM_03198 [Rhodopirellula maiorica SM1]|uniref:Uncharacterized protein n=1 Tax=Rhodopirellula maiorica SM1 TaxID=1265738 RepID=M5RWU6_9BACT|nr:hypothetical protein RMSM_03198 [Rhodopirellula maiorica SM1]
MAYLISSNIAFLPFPSDVTVGLGCDLKAVRRRCAAISIFLSSLAAS